MPKIKFTFTRSVRQIATREVELNQEDYEKVRKFSPDQLSAYALFGVAVYIPKDEWKRDGIASTFPDVPDPTFLAIDVETGANLNKRRGVGQVGIAAQDIGKGDTMVVNFPMSADQPIHKLGPKLPDHPHWRPTGGSPIKQNGFWFYAYRTGVNRYVRHCPELDATVHTDGNRKSVDIRGEFILSASGKVKKFNGERIAFAEAVRVGMDKRK